LDVAGGGLTCTTTFESTGSIIGVAALSLLTVLAVLRRRVSRTR